VYNGSPAVMPIFGFGRGGVPAALVARGDASRPDSTFFDFEYDVPSTAKIGSVQESGVGFTAAGLVPPGLAGDGWGRCRDPRGARHMPTPHRQPVVGPSPESSRPAARGPASAAVSPGGGSVNTASAVDSIEDLASGRVISAVRPQLPVSIPSCSTLVARRR
jgi:hypothetical protein